MEQKVLITGATSGIGLQLAVDYAKEGWSVIACGRNAEKLAALKAQASGIETLQFNVCEQQETLDALATLKDPPSLWIFNAGDCEYIEQGVVDVSLFQRVFQINVFGLLHCFAGSQKHFKAGHHIAIVTSIAGEVALPRAEAYGASKAAVTYFGRCVKIALARKGMDVTLVYPGFVKTPLTDKNTFPMPLRVGVEFASKKIRQGLKKRKSNIYFPMIFTGFLRFIALLPYHIQFKLVEKFIRE